MTEEYTIYQVTSGEYVATITAPDLDNVLLNVGEGQIAVEGDLGPLSYWNGVEALMRPSIPTPVFGNQRASFSDPPPGLHVKLYDETFGGYFMGEGDLALPEADVMPSTPGKYRFEFTADWPYLPLEITEVL